MISSGSLHMLFAEHHFRLFLLESSRLWLLWTYNDLLPLIWLFCISVLASFYGYRCIQLIAFFFLIFVECYYCFWFCIKIASALLTHFQARSPCSLLSKNSFYLIYPTIPLAFISLFQYIYLKHLFLPSWSNLNSVKTAFFDSIWFSGCLVLKFGHIVSGNIKKF